MAEYQQALLVYLDVLGFRDLIQQSEKDSTRVDEIIQVLHVMKQQASAGMFLRQPKTHPECKAQTQNFSDLIIRARPVGSDEDLLAWVNLEMIILASMQTELSIEHGILVRGGMCLANLYMTDEFVFGPALVRSYVLAEEIAVFPRIAIDSAVLDLKSKGLLFNAYRIQGDDGVHFIDYLYGSHQQPYDGFSKYEDGFELLRSHKGLVERKLNEFSGKSERVKQKAIWLALYHNSVLNRIIAQSPEKKDRLIGLFVQDEQIRI